MATPASHDLEQTFVESMRDGSRKWQGIIIFLKEEGQFVYLPNEGFPGCEPLSSLITVDLGRVDLTRSDRLTAFKIKAPGEEEETDAFIFSRVEEGKPPGRGPVSRPVPKPVLQ